MVRLFEIDIKCLQVNDMDKVDLDVMNEEDPDYYEYASVAKENGKTILKRITFNPDWPGTFKLKRMKVPSGTQVISVVTDATEKSVCDYFQYAIYYEYANSADNCAEIMRPSSEKCMFMVTPKMNGSIAGSELLTFSFAVGDMYRYLIIEEEGKNIEEWSGGPCDGFHCNCCVRLSDSESGAE